jgi:cytochrome P450
MWPDWLPLPYKRRKRAAIATLDAFIRNVVRERRAARTDRGDLLSMLLLAVDGEGRHPGMTDEQVRNEAMTLFNAGHDTTAAGLTWLLYVMAHKPDVQERVTSDVRSTEQGELDRVIKETLRIYPPAFALFARESTREIILKGYTIPARTTFFVSPYVMHHDSRFFERPDTFDPDRFRPERESSIPRFAYMPFGIGPHMCIGAGFATLEMKTVVTAILERFRLTLRQGPDGFTPLLSLRPRRPVIVRVEERDGRRPGTM